MKVLVVCAGGISTNILAANMRKFAREGEWVKALSTIKLDGLLDNCDLVLVAPQICYAYESICQDCENKEVLCELLDMEMYGRMDGEAILNLARDLIDKNEKGGEVIQMKRLKVTLACAGGVSTSILCTKMIQAIKAHGIEDVECCAYSTSALDKAAPGSDVILLGPQVCYLEDEIVKRYPDIPVRLMDMRDYGTMNAKKIVDELFEEFHWEK